MEVSKEAPKRANKKETERHTTLTLELSTMKTQKQKKEMNSKTPKIKNFIATKKEKKVRKRKKSVPQKKANVGSTTTLCTSSKKSCKRKLEKKTLRAMIGSLEKSEREK